MYRRIFMSCFLIVFLIVPVLTQAAITKGPYLIKPGQTSMTVMWESDTSEEAVFQYGPNADMEYSLPVTPLAKKNDLYLYQAPLENLKTDIKYFYQIKMSELKTRIFRFHTAPPPGRPLDFVAIGDSRTGHEINRSISDMILDLDPELVINMGDLVQTGGKFEQWGPHYFEPAAEVMDHIPLISTLGDHDTQVDNGENFQYYLRPASSAEKLWFSYDFGPAHFVSLDYRGEDDPEMMAWFEEDMAASKAEWKFVYLHRPSYNLGGHRTNWGAGRWPALYRKHKVDIVFAGHSHMYERFYPMRPKEQPDAWPVTYITTGGAGAGLYDAVQDDYLAVSRSVNHLMYLKINGDTLASVTLLLDGSLIDRFQMIKKDGRYDPVYLQLVKDQDLMDVQMLLASELEIHFDQIPTLDNPAVKELTLESNAISGKTKIDIQLAPQSMDFYKMKPVQGVLEKGKPFSAALRIYARQPLTVKGRYFDPPLYLNARFQNGGKEGVAIGRECRYYPQEE